MGDVEDHARVDARAVELHIPVVEVVTGGRLLAHHPSRQQPSDWRQATDAAAESRIAATSPNSQPPRRAGSAGSACVDLQELRVEVIDLERCVLDPEALMQHSLDPVPGRVAVLVLGDEYMS